MKEITTFDVFIDEESELGVDKISLVRKPAILTDFIYMNEEVSDVYSQVSLSDDEKRIITGPALIPDQEIIRKDEDGEPYYIKYSAEQIEKIVQKFFKAKDQYSVNKDHKSDVNDVYIYESWITGENDKSKDLGFDVPKGTWILSMKVENEEIWSGIKSGKYKGFSIEGLFKFKRTSKLVKQKKWSRKDINSANVDRVMFNDETNELVVKFNDGSKYTYFNINFSEFNSVVSGLADCKTEGQNKWGEWFVGKTPSVGAAVWEYLINTGKAYTKGGTFQEEIELVYPNAGEDEDEFINRCMGSDEMNNEFPDQEQRAAVCYTYWKEKQNLEKDTKNKKINMVSAILKDGSTLYTDADAMEVGVEVYFMNGEEKIKPEAGEYVLEDDSIVVIGEDSKISEIKTAEAEVESGYEDKDKEKETMEDGMMVNPDMEAIKGMLENISMKLDLLMGEKMSAVQQSVANLEDKIEKMSIDAEMKSVETVDSKKKVAQSGMENKKAPLDYNLITRLNKKF